MLNSLRLINFRRHVDTEIDLSNDAQIVAIAGRNGSGKSSILEGIVYGFYGEGKNGRRGLAKLVRRAAVHEGMQVELSFTVGDVTYDITRRFEKGKSSATMFANGNKVMQSPDGVTAEVTRVLGMDAVGFRLAVIAQQFDVDGLADLTPARRKATVTRLLRQDALTTATKQARDLYRRELDIVRAMGAGPDLDALQAELSAARTELDEAQAAVRDSREVLLTVDAELAATADVEANWQAAQIALARADATAAATRAESDRIEAEVREVRVPGEVPAPERSVDKITVEISEVNVAIARGQSARELADEAAATRADLEKVTARLAELETTLGTDTPATVAMAVTKVGRSITEAEGRLKGHESARDELRTTYGSIDGQLAELRRRSAAAATLGDVCDACEQSISDEHKHQQEAARAERVAQLETELKQTLTAGEALAQQVAAAGAEIAALRAERDQLTRRRGTVEAGVREREDLERRRAQYTARLDRIVAEPVDLEALFTRKGLLEIEKAQAEQAEQVARAREAALERLQRLQDALAAVTERLEAALSARAAAEPDADLIKAHARRLELVQRRADEAELVGAVETEAAAAAERVTSVERAVAGAAEQHARAAKHRDAANRAAKAAQVLSETASKMATLIRPALEGEISTLLQQLSEGRFTAVRVSDDYEITVEDDGKFEPLTEFSGGESVLIALATRLALANVVSGRHGSGGAGFLILDEVFGSQDETRREAILGGLRTLRAFYGQILLISHVGGFEEAADRVLQVSAASLDGQRIAEVTAA